MGVKDLWEILDTVGHGVEIEDLQGKVLAVDISVWIYQSLGPRAVKKKPGLKPHLRTLYWRIKHLMKHNIKPIVVFDGPAPRLKYNTLRKRYGSMPGSKGPSYFDLCVKECQALLEVIGIPFIVASGEADASCAILNLKGVADGVIANDGDSFLFGAQTVYTNFSANVREAEKLVCYEAPDINKKLGLDRKSLVALALLVGCDYTDGAFGVGKEHGAHLVRSWKHIDVLDRLRSWRGDKHLNTLMTYKTLPKPSHCGNCSHPGTKPSHAKSGCTVCQTERGCESSGETSCDCEYHLKTREYNGKKVELQIRQRAIKDKKFPSEKIINAFLKPEDINTNGPFNWDRPDFGILQSHCQENIEIPHHKAEDLAIEMIISYDINQRRSDQDKTCRSTVDCIEKSKVVNGVDMFVVKWEAVDGVPQEYMPLRTEENKCVFSSVFPLAVQDFEKSKYTRSSCRKVPVKRTTGPPTPDYSRRQGKKGTGISTPDNNERQGKVTEFFPTQKKVIKRSLNDDAARSPRGPRTPVKRSLNFGSSPPLKKKKLRYSATDSCFSDSDSDAGSLPDMEGVFPL